MELQASTTSETEVKAAHPVNQITPVSKYLALALFIILPFIGGYIGYMYSSTTVVEVPMEELAVEIGPVVVPDSAPIAASFNKGDIVIPYVETSEVRDLMKVYPNEFSGTKTVRANKITLPEYSDENSGFLTENDIADSDAFFDGPFALMVATPDYLIFSLIPFGKDGGLHGLFKLDKDGNFTELKTSRHNHFQSLATLSPDKTKIASTNGLEIGYVDLSKDEFITLRSLDPKETKRFNGGCELGCEGLVEWEDNNTLTVRVYEYDSCDVGTYIPKDVGDTTVVYECAPFYAERFTDEKISL